MTRATRLHAYHGPILYALLAQAYGAARNQDPGVPDGVLLDAPEQARLWLAKGSQFAFGLTLLAADRQAAGTLCDELVDGLRQVGRRAGQAKTALAGNFEIDQVEDLVAAAGHRAGYGLQAMPEEIFQGELARVAGATELTLRFLTPLRAHRSKKTQRDGHRFFDRERFEPRAFVQRLAARLAGLGLDRPALTEEQLAALAVSDNRLIWLDVSYGPRQSRTALGGAVGRIILAGVSPAVAELLVRGQYVRIGEATRFGLGAYRVEQLGPEPFPCARATDLLTLAAANPALDQAAETLDLPPGELREAARELTAGTYQPRPHFRVDIPKADGGYRTLAIPSRLDRALQRGVLEEIGPAVDLFLEESSLAYRRGLGRHTAARRLHEAFAEGYRWALKADFHTFFDSVDHRQLRERLEAYLADERLVEMLLRWVEAGAPAPGRGVPTGAPLSPLLTNLFLDEFDEEVARHGHCLLRYADDFVILFRRQEDAQAVLAATQHAAEQLQLELNQQKTHAVDLSEPFEFLGFRFERHESWDLLGPDGPRPIEELGWTERARLAAEPALPHLAGESELTINPPGTVIAGPGIAELQVHGEKLQLTFRDGRPLQSLALAGIHELFLIGSASLTEAALAALARHSIPVLLVDEVARLVAAVEPYPPAEDAAAVTAQVIAAQQEPRQLELAKRLVEAKLHNYAALADAYRGPRNDVRTAVALRRLAQQVADVQSTAELLGVEGSGAALWYGALGQRLPNGFWWERRVAPAARDPVNALLNLAQTILHRHLIHMVRQAGLVPAVGLFHRPRSGHAALASDMQEPFRHLMDRAVLETCARIRPDDFESVEHGPYALRIKPRAVRELLAWVHRVLARSCAGAEQSEPRPYRVQAWQQVRSLKRWLLEPEQPFQPFRHP